MKRIKRSALCAILTASILGMLLSGCDKGATASDASQPLTPTEAQVIAKDAYIFHYSLVYYYRTMYRQAVDEQAGVGFGNWLHMGVSSPKDQDIPSPNNDSPYSYAWLDLRAEPWVLTMPKIEKDRFYTSQWDDMWGFVIENAGSVFDGNDGVSIMFAAPDWKGEAPEGIKRVVTGDSSFLGTLTRTQLIEPKDFPNVEKIQGQYKLQPLSAFLGQEPAPAAPEIEWLPWVEQLETTEAFWTYANFLLQFTTPNAEDADILARSAKIGVGPGKAWDAESFSPEIREAIASGMKDAIKQLKEGSVSFDDPSLFFRTRKDLDGDYYNRALGALVGAFGNWKSISVYFAAPKDEQGQLLDGSKHSYELHFSKEEIPPVSYFWSWTMYSLPNRYLVDNPISRYSIGNATPGLKTAEDGSISLYFSAKSPGKDKESNWLPAPEGPFWLVLRTYGPGEAILDKTWKVPPVKQVK